MRKSLDCPAPGYPQRVGVSRVVKFAISWSAQPQGVPNGESARSIPRPSTDSQWNAQSSQPQSIPGVPAAPQVVRSAQPQSTVSESLECPTTEYSSANPGVPNQSVLFLFLGVSTQPQIMPRESSECSWSAQQGGDVRSEYFLVGGGSECAVRVYAGA